jgi:L-arabinose isomerase
MTMIRAVAESQAFGSQAIANGWMRKGREFQVIHHIPGTPDGDAAIRGVLNAIGVCQQLPHLRMGLIGQPFQGMTDIILPSREFTVRTGARIVEIPMRRIHNLMRKQSPAQLVFLEEKLSRTFSIEQFSAMEKETSLRAALAIQQVVTEERLNCAAFNSHGREGLESEKLGLMCALGVTLATTAGCPLSEVGDLCTAFAMWLGRNLGGASFYTELDSAYLSAHDWLLLNSGEYDLAWLREGCKPRLLRNANFQGIRGRGASVCAPLRTGPATIVNFTPTPRGERPYRIQFCEGTIMREWCPEMGVGNARFKIAGDARAVYEQWLAAGPVHHSATSPGHLGQLLQIFSQSQNWSCLRIG